ncbi:MAG: sugar-binding protein [Oscillospiraceae bacterium]|jgi:putative multiple sugar transport system substrate-binding protein|nr:sugar-binding protein [Oscillospiraceae bacterium]
MKRFLAILMVTVLALAGLATSALAADRVGVLMPTQSLQRWNQDGDNMKSQLETAGYEVDLQYADNKVDVQVSQIENMLLGGVKVLVIASIDGGSLGTVLAAAKDMSVPVIAYDRLITGTEFVDYYATFDNYRVGQLQGSFIEEKLGLKDGNGPFNLEIVAGSPDDNNALFFYNGAMDLLKPYIENGQLVVPSGQTELAQVGTLAWSTDTAQARFDNIIAANYADGSTKLDAVLCSNDSTALGVINALTNAGFTEYPIITGQDCDKPNMQHIISGVQSMSVFKDTRTLASKVVSMVEALLKGSDPEINDTTTYNNGVKVVPSYLCEPVFGDASNYKELLIDSGYYTLEDIGQ